VLAARNIRRLMSYSVSAVRMVRDTPPSTIFHPYYSLRHGMAGGRKGLHDAAQWLAGSVLDTKCAA
jgi:hypothetical protein